MGKPQTWGTPLFCCNGTPNGNGTGGLSNPHPHQGLFTQHCLNASPAPQVEVEVHPQPHFLYPHSTPLPPLQLPLRSNSPDHTIVYGGSDPPPRGGDLRGDPFSILKKKKHPIISYPSQVGHFGNSGKWYSFFWRHIFSPQKYWWAVLRRCR